MSSSFLPHNAQTLAGSRHQQQRHGFQQAAALPRVSGLLPPPRLQQAFAYPAASEYSSNTTRLQHAQHLPPSTHEQIAQPLPVTQAPCRRVVPESSGSVLHSARVQDWWAREVEIYNEIESLWFNYKVQQGSTPDFSRWKLAIGKKGPCITEERFRYPGPGKQHTAVSKTKPSARGPQGNELGLRNQSQKNVHRSLSVATDIFAGEGAWKPNTLPTQNSPQAGIHGALDGRNSAASPDSLNENDDVVITGVSVAKKRLFSQQADSPSQQQRNGMGAYDVRNAEVTANIPPSIITIHDDGEPPRKKRRGNGPATMPGFPGSFTAPPRALQSQSAFLKQEVLKGRYPWLTASDAHVSWRPPAKRAKTALDELSQPSKAPEQRPSPNEVMPKERRPNVPANTAPTRSNSPVSTAEGYRRSTLSVTKPQPADLSSRTVRVGGLCLPSGGTHYGAAEASTRTQSTEAAHNSPIPDLGQPAELTNTVVMLPEDEQQERNEDENDFLSLFGEDSNHRASCSVPAPILPEDELKELDTDENDFLSLFGEDSNHRISWSVLDT